MERNNIKLGAQSGVLLALMFIVSIATEAQNEGNNAIYNSGIAASTAYTA
jgi:hypothetical protein